MGPRGHQTVQRARAPAPECIRTPGQPGSRPTLSRWEVPRFTGPFRTLESTCRDDVEQAVGDVRQKQRPAFLALAEIDPGPRGLGVGLLDLRSVCTNDSLQARGNRANPMPWSGPVPTDSPPQEFSTIDVRMGFRLHHRPSAYSGTNADRRLPPHRISSPSNASYLHTRKPVPLTIWRLPRSSASRRLHESSPVWR